MPNAMIITAGSHLREHAPITVVMPENELPPSSLAELHGGVLGEACRELTDALEQLQVGEHMAVASMELVQNNSVAKLPVQIEQFGGKIRAHCIVPRLEINQCAQVKLSADAVDSPSHVQLQAKEEDCEIAIHIGDALFTAYQYSNRYVRPFLYPVIGPFGDPVTRELEGDPKMGFDHIHHRSIYTAWGDVNGVDVWSEEKGHGYMRHHCFGRIVSGPVFGQISAHVVWTDESERPLMDQVTVYRFYALPRSHRLVDIMIAFHATHGDVKFGDTKEGGILSLRVYPTMTVRNGGRLENSYGGVNEDEVWGRRAHWCDYSGVVNGNWVGVAIFDHPNNFRYPTYWHARNYGLMTANPFGLSAFLGEGYDGTYTLPAGQWFIFRYRLYIHVGDAQVGRVREHYLNYVAPPVCQLAK